MKIRPEAERTRHVQGRTEGPQRPWSGRKGTRTKKSGRNLPGPHTTELGTRLEGKPSLSTAADVAAGGGAVGGSDLEPHTRCIRTGRELGPAPTPPSGGFPGIQRVAAKSCHGTCPVAVSPRGSACSQTLLASPGKGSPMQSGGPGGDVAVGGTHVIARPGQTRCREGSSPAATEKDAKVRPRTGRPGLGGLHTK